MQFELLNVNNNTLVSLLKSATPPIIWNFLYRTLVIKNIAHADSYHPHYQQWREDDFKKLYTEIRHNTGCPIDSVYFLQHFCEQTLRLKGDVLEAGVWKGGTAKVLADTIRVKNTLDTARTELHLFDSFSGMKEVDLVEDRHNTTDFSDTSLESVKNFVAAEDLAHYYPGWLPQTFEGLENLEFCFCHIDLDLYKSIKDCLDFVYPRLASGGVIIFDDYGYASCPGALKAADEFFQDKTENVLSLHTGQGLIIKAS